MKNPTIGKIILGLACLSLPMLAQAANVSLIASDGSGTTSMNTAGKWSNSQAPTSANDYYTGPYFVRTPPNNSGITFAGHSLTLQDVSGNPGTGGQGSPYRSILYKGTGGDTIVINNLTNAAGSVLNNGGSGTVAAPTFTGNQWTIAGNSTMLSDQGSTIIGYPLAGSGVILTNTSGQSRTITYTGNLSGFSGKFYIFSTCTVALNSGSSNLGNPASSAPDQITIGNGCVLQDNTGITFNNANGGITLSGPGTATISAASSTIMAEPITDLTNGVSSTCSLTSAGAGTLKLSAVNNYTGGTIISAGILQVGIANAIPVGTVTDNGTLDINGFSTTIDGLSGSGTVDTSSGGTPTLTVGVNGGGGTLAGVIQDSAGTLSLTKLGAGTLTLSGGYTYTGNTVVGGGTLGLVSSAALPSSPGSLTISNGATVTANVSLGNPLPVNNLTLVTNSSLSLTLNPTTYPGINGVNVAGNLVLDDNATNNINYGTVTANPTTTTAIVVTGGISAPGTNIVINIAATGLQPGTFSLIKYTGTQLASLANFQVSPPPGVAAVLVNNAHSIDLQITSIPNVLTWNGVNGTSWDLSTANWTNTINGGITVFGQYTNGSVIAGDSVTFDDTLTNDLVNPQPTNITLNSTFFAFPVLVNSSLPYSISGSGGITGVTSLVLSNTGSLTLLTSNSYTGGTIIANGALIVGNDSALGAASGPVTLSGTTLQYNGSTTNNVRTFSMPVASTIGVSGNSTVRLGGVISGAGANFNVTNTGTLILAAREGITGDVFLHQGTTIIDTGGSFTNANYDDVGQINNDSATLVMRNTGAFSTTSDFNLGDLNNAIGTLYISNSATLNMNAFYIGSANATGSTAMGIVNQSGGTITEVSTAVGTFCIGGRTSVSAVGVYNMSGGTVTANAGIRVGSTGIGTLNQSGGLINALQGINIARIAGSFGTNNLNGGTLSTYNIASSTGTNAVFNFNGGILQANFAPASPWFSGTIQANVLAGGAFIDSSNNNVAITTPLVAGSANGGLTKLGTGTLTLSGTNTFTGPITNNAGTLVLNSLSTYAGGAVVNAGTLQVSTAPAVQMQGPTIIGNGGLLSLSQVGGGDLIISNLTFNGAASGSGGSMGVTPTSANNPNAALVNCGTLTLNGTNSVSLAAVDIGTTALIKYYGSLAGSGNITNLILPQGATGYVSNNAANSTLYAVVTSTGPGLVWTGTNTLALNTWNINGTTNWLVNSAATSYHQIINPGDAVIFNDIGSGTVILNTNVAPANMVISNNAKAYAFSGSGNISGGTGLLKLGNNTATLGITNQTYTGNTTISNGTIQIGGLAAISPNANLVVGPSGTLELAGITTSIGELTGGGVIDNNSGINPTLTVGTGTGGIWNGTVQDHGAGGVALHKNGTGTWVVGGSNTFNDGQPFTDINEVNAGTMVITNGGVVQMSTLQMEIASASGDSAAVTVAGGTLAVNNNVLSVGYSAGATGTLIVNGGTVNHGGTAAGAGFAAVANSIDVGAQGATGTMIVNGGQVLNNGILYLGDGSGASGVLDLNGGLVQATVVEANSTPTVSTAYFNGGTLQAATNSSDFLLVSSMVMSNSLILDDGGYTVSIVSQSLQDGDGLGGGLVKQGSGTVYLDSGSLFSGTTLVTNGMLAGVGSVNGPLVVAPTGTLGAGDAVPGSPFNIYNTLTLQGNAFMRINKTGGSTSQDQVNVSGNISYGGTLIITNITSDANVLTTSDSFQLYNGGGSYAGNFTSIIGSPGAGLAYSFSPANGTLSIVSNTIPSYGTNISFSVSGSTLSLSWPSVYLGSILQSQTNTLTTGLTTAPNTWFDVPGSSATTSMSFGINPANPTVFYRLRHP